MAAGNKAIELQLQMRQNAEDLHSFMKDLDSWETDIKKKDDELRTGSSGGDLQVCCSHLLLELLIFSLGSLKPAFRSQKVSLSLL